MFRGLKRGAERIGLLGYDGNRKVARGLNMRLIMVNFMNAMNRQQKSPAFGRGFQALRLLKLVFDGVCVDFFDDVLFKVSIAHCVLCFALSQSNGDGMCVKFFLSDYQLIGDFLLLPSSDFCVHAVVAEVGKTADTFFLQVGRN